MLQSLYKKKKLFFYILLLILLGTQIPKNPNNKNFVIVLGITIFLNEYVGIVLINNTETIIVR